MNNCEHKHTRPTGYPTFGLLCVDCARVLDRDGKPFSGRTLHQAVSVNHKTKAELKQQAEEDKKLWD